MRSLCLIIMIIVVAWSTSLNAERTQTLLISLDGFRADKLDKFLKDYPESTLQKLIVEKGVKADYMKPSFPTLTFPNHHSIITGKYIDKHDIVGNTIYDPAYDIKINLLSGNATIKLDPMFWNTTEPIWLTAKNQGLKTASFFWAGSEVWTRHPNFFLIYNDLYLFEQRCDEVVSWFTLFQMDFVTLYFDEPDHTGHGYGPDSNEYWNMIKQMDKTLGYLFDKLIKTNLIEKINIIVLSDHGMTTMQPPEKSLIISDYVDMNLVQTFRTIYGPVSNIHPRNSSSFVKEQLYEQLKKIPNLKVYYKEEMPQDLNYNKSRRIAPIVAIADEGYTLGTFNATLAGNHGFDNKLASMRAIFMARGPNFKQNVRLDPFENVNVYFLLCKLIDVKCLPGDGSIEPFKSVIIDTPSKNLAIRSASSVNFLTTFGLLILSYLILFFKS